MAIVFAIVLAILFAFIFANVLVFIFMKTANRFGNMIAITI